jgi:hypothetical protein
MGRLTMEPEFSDPLALIPASVIVLGMIALVLML